MNILSARSCRKIEDIHPDLLQVVLLACELTEQPFQVSEGLRTLDRQKKLLKRGATRTLNSRHLTGHAVDLYATEEDGTGALWQFALYCDIADAMFAAADQLDVDLKWGGNWPKFRDGPHFYLSRQRYPAKKEAPAHAGEVLSLFAGCSGDVVHVLQQSLRSLGFGNIEPDGDFGPRTRSAVKTFQQQHGLIADGIVGPQTRKALQQALQQK
ncbi:peptidoglycan-binding protein [Polycladidibacter hongkongensis]|uniref:peptidoglycan-binding protein n=1 Tax=Polycladidibacter hongkongensis TaxID=1647556 RepID=UPI000AA2F72D|nr:peptidoglycan-binding protein [Pseudovibrio hongkongensis]